MPPTTPAALAALTAVVTIIVAADVAVRAGKQIGRVSKRAIIAPLMNTTTTRHILPLQIHRRISVAFGLV